MRVRIILCTALLSLLSLPALASGPLVSKTHLSDAQEVADPPVISDGRARAVIRFDKGLTQARVNVRFRHLVGNVTRLHLHCNVAGANGPIAIGLIDKINADFDNSQVITEDGHRIFGVLTNDEFPAADACLGVVERPVNNIASLAAAIDAGLVYWNLHSDVFPAGELRGQVRPLEKIERERDDRDDDKYDDEYDD